MTCETNFPCVHYSILPNIEFYIIQPPIRMFVMGPNPFQGPLEEVGPKNRDFFGPLNGTSVASAIWAQKSRDIDIDIGIDRPRVPCSILFLG